MTITRPLPGVALMLGFCALAPLGDAFAKLLGASVPLGQVLLVRFAIQTLILWPIFRASGQVLRFPLPVWWLIVLRTLLQIAGVGAIVLALRHLPLADTIAIAYVMPFLLLLLGWLLLGEAVGPHRIAACAVGFAGTLMVMQPSFAVAGWAATLPLLVALLFALYMLVTRRLSADASPIPLQAAGGLIGTLVLLPLILLADGRGWPELDPIGPDLPQLLLLVAFATTGTAAHLFITWSLRFAPTATLAPIQYLELPFAVLYGWVFFAQFPDWPAFGGILVIIGAGLYIVRRERLIARARALQAPRRAPSAAG